MTKLEKARDYEVKNQTDPNRQPAFHLTPPVGWMNDPNGFSVYNGKVHLFYQYHPYDLRWGPMHWGHQSSVDMIVWDRMPVVLAPDQPYDQDGCFSGTAIATDAGHLLVYTGVTKENGVEVQNQCVAIGDGRVYRKHDRNPVVRGEMMPAGFSRTDFRDPKIWKEDENWWMVVGSRDEKRGQIALFASDNGMDWKYERVLLAAEDGFGTMWECPDFFRLDGKSVLVCSPQNVEAIGYTFHNGHNGVAFVGESDAMNFQGVKAQPLDYGFDFYAPQTTTLPDGRQVLIAWMSSWHSPIVASHQTWSAQMTLPRELSLRKGKLIQQPVRELETWYKETVRYKQVPIQEPQSVAGVEGRYVDFTIRFSKPATSEFTMDLAKDERYGTRFTVDPKKGIVELDRTFSGLKEDVVTIRRAKIPAEGIQTIRVVMDLYSIELFINEGEMTMSCVIPTVETADQIVFGSEEPIEVDLDFHTIDARAIRAKREVLA